MKINGILANSSTLSRKQGKGVQCSFDYLINLWVIQHCSNASAYLLKDVI